MLIPDNLVQLSESEITKNLPYEMPANIAQLRFLQRLLNGEIVVLDEPIKKLTPSIHMQISFQKRLNEEDRYKESINRTTNFIKGYRESLHALDWGKILSSENDLSPNQIDAIDSCSEPQSAYRIVGYGVSELSKFSVGFETMVLVEFGRHMNPLPLTVRSHTEREFFELLRRSLSYMQ